MTNPSAEPATTPASSVSPPPVDTWVDAYGGILFRYTISRVPDHNIAEDIVQETLVAALAAQGKFNGQCAFSTWLVGILKHKVLDYFRAQHRQPAASLDDDKVVESMFNNMGHWRNAPKRWHMTAEQAAESAELSPLIQACLEALPPMQREAIVMRLMDDQAADEVCKTLQLSATNLYVLLHRARLRLRNCLEKKGVDQLE